jgi:hypothetical protein
MSLLPPGFCGKPLELSLGVLDAIGEAEMVIMPSSPTPGMIGAATRAASVDEAMVREEE